MSTAPPTAEESEETLYISGMSCAACQIHVERALQSVPGVEEASVDLLGRRAQVRGRLPMDRTALAAAVQDAGYRVVDRSNAAQEGDSATSGSAGEAGEASLGWRAAISLIAGLPAMLLSMPLMAEARAAADPLSRFLMRVTMPAVPLFLFRISAQSLRWILCSLALTTMLFAGPEIYTAAWRAARHRTTNMNTLVALGTLSAFSVSLAVTVTDALGRPSVLLNDVYYEAVVLILALLLTGRWLEAHARRRALNDLRGSARVEAGQARWLGDALPEPLATLMSSPETLLPVDALAVGDLLRVLPGDRVPLDAEVLLGRSAVDESMLTGEPLPVTRERGDRVLGGTLNLDGALVLRALAVGADSTLAQMDRLLERARSKRAPMQQLADRASAVFVPTILVVAALTFAVWAAVDTFGPQPRGLGRAISLSIAVLVIACPCAMGLAVPATVAVALGTAARAGLLFKGGEALERLATADLMAFDKTGTLTEGRPKVIAFVRAPGTRFEHGDLLSWASAVEQLSSHPLASAVVAYANESGAKASLAAEGTVLPGIGAEANVAGHRVSVGSRALLPSGSASVTPTALQEATPMHLIVDGEHAGSFFAVDQPRASAKPTLAQLAELRLKTVLLTGDTPEAARGLAAELGIPDVQARLLPADKVLAIETLQRAGRRVAMAGDGLNDAAALAQADVGIAVASGTALARDAGHVLLLHHDLRLIPLGIRLSRKARRLMRQNLGWAVVYNLLGIPIAAGVLQPHFGIALSPALASAAMALSSVSVLLNSLRLRHLPRAWTTAPGGEAPIR